jgi:hypothetical protein
LHVWVHVDVSNVGCVSGVGCEAPWHVGASGCVAAFLAERWVRGNVSCTGGGG